MTINYLQPNELVAGRLFTHPFHVQTEIRILRYMVQHLGGILARYEGFVAETVLHTAEPDGRQHRLVISQPEALRHARELTVVGFLGQRRYDTDPEPITRIDQQLLDELPLHTGLYSYGSMELTNGDYSNCVLFADEAAKNRWGQSEMHIRQALTLSPAYYFSVRIYNGRLPAGLAHPDQLALTRAKYYDFQEEPVWKGERAL